MAATHQPALNLPSLQLDTFRLASLAKRRLSHKTAFTTEDVVETGILVGQYVSYKDQNWLAVGRALQRWDPGKGLQDEQHAFNELLDQLHAVRMVSHGNISLQDLIALVDSATTGHHVPLCMHCHRGDESGELRLCQLCENAGHSRCLQDAANALAVKQKKAAEARAREQARGDPGLGGAWFCSGCTLIRARLSRKLIDNLISRRRSEQWKVTLPRAFLHRHFSDEELEALQQRKKLTVQLHVDIGDTRIQCGSYKIRCDRIARRGSGSQAASAAPSPAPPPHLPQHSQPQVAGPSAAGPSSQQQAEEVGSEEEQEDEIYYQLLGSFPHALGQAIQSHRIYHLWKYERPAVSEVVMHMPRLCIPQFFAVGPKAFTDRRSFIVLDAVWFNCVFGASAYFTVVLGDITGNDTVSVDRLQVFPEVFISRTTKAVHLDDPRVLQATERITGSAKMRARLERMDTQVLRVLVELDPYHQPGEATPPVKRLRRPASLPAPTAPNVEGSGDESEAPRGSVAQTEGQRLPVARSRSQGSSGPTGTSPAPPKRRRTGTAARQTDRQQNLSAAEPDRAAPPTTALLWVTKHAAQSPPDSDTVDVGQPALAPPSPVLRVRAARDSLHPSGAMSSSSAGPVYYMPTNEKPQLRSKLGRSTEVGSPRGRRQGASGHGSPAEELLPGNAMRQVAVASAPRSSHWRSAPELAGQQYEAQLVQHLIQRATAPIFVDSQAGQHVMVQDQHRMAQPLLASFMQAQQQRQQQEPRVYTEVPSSFIMTAPHLHHTYPQVPGGFIRPLAAPQTVPDAQYVLSIAQQANALVPSTWVLSEGPGGQQEVTYFTQLPGSYAFAGQSGSVSEVPAVPAGPPVSAAIRPHPLPAPLTGADSRVSDRVGLMLNINRLQRDRHLRPDQSQLLATGLELLRCLWGPAGSSLAASQGPVTDVMQAFIVDPATFTEAAVLALTAAMELLLAFARHNKNEKLPAPPDFVEVEVRQACEMISAVLSRGGDLTVLELKTFQAVFVACHKLLQALPGQAPGADQQEPLQAAAWAGIAAVVQAILTRQTGDLLDPSILEFASDALAVALELGVRADSVPSPALPEVVREVLDAGTKFLLPAWLARLGAQSSRNAQAASSPSEAMSSCMETELAALATAWGFMHFLIQQCRAGGCSQVLLDCWEEARQTVEELAKGSGCYTAPQLRTFVTTFETTVEMLDPAYYMPSPPASPDVPRPVAARRHVLDGSIISGLEQAWS